MARAARRCLALAACLAASGEGARLQPEAAAEDRSALYQQGLQVHRLSQPRSELSAPDMALKLQARTGKQINAEDLEGAPITEEPWQRLERHEKAFAVVNGAIAAMEGPIEDFLQRTTGRKATLRLGRSEGTINAEALADTLRPIADEWHGIAHAFKGVINETSRPFLDELSLDCFTRMGNELETFTSKVEWFAKSSLIRVPRWGELGVDMLPAQLQVEQAIIDEFTEQKDQMLQTWREIIEELFTHLGEDARESFTFIGNGTCVDSSKRYYSSYEALGCETIISCLSGCRKFRANECLGVTFSTQDGCGRCELRMEANFSGKGSGWYPSWSDGTAQGDIASTAAAVISNTNCWKRVPAEWQSWPKQIQGFLEEDIQALSQKYTNASGSALRLFFKLDRAFWQVESGVALAAPAIATSDWS